jgi:hypothetical protein
LFASQLRLLIYYYCITKVLDDLLGDGKADLFVGLLAPPVKEGDFDLVPGLQKFGDLIHFDLEIMGANFEPEAHLFKIQRFRRLAILLLLLSALVVKLSPIDNLANWRIRIWRNFYQVEVAFARNIQSLLLA